MKKNLWKKVLSFGLAFAMSISLCACGEEGTPTGNGGTGSSGNNGGKVDPNSALAKENVYELQEFELPEIEADSFNIQSTTHKDGMLYMILLSYNWTTGNGEEEVTLLSMKDDGTDAKLIPLEIPGQEEESGEVEGNVGGGASTMPMPRTEDAESEVEEGTAAEETTAEDTTTEDATTEDGTADKPVIDDGVVDEEYNPNIYEHSYYSNYKLGGDGKIYATKNYFYEDYSDPENYISNNKTYVCSWDVDGKYLWETELEGLQSEEEYLYIGNIAVLNDGTVNVMLTGDNVYRVQVKDGVASEKTPLSEEVGKIFSNHGTIIAKEDGTLLVTYYDENDWSKMFMASYDPTTDAVGTSVELPSSFSWSGYHAINAGISSDLIYATDDGVYTLNVGQTESVQKMNYINSDIPISYVEGIVELDDKSFVAVFYDMYDYEMSVGKFTYVDPATIPDKSVMILAGTYVNTNIKKRVIEYNRESDTHRIVLKEYDSYNTYDDYQAGYTKLNNDIITGNMPDILIADNLPTENYVSKGLLVDIGALIEKDAELSQVEFMQNVFDAYSVDGKLYYVIPGFNVNTMIAKSSIVGDRTSWTMAEMQELWKSLPEGTEMFGDLTRSYFFNMVMQYCGGDFVDVETGKCEFNSQNFIEMMEFGKTLPEELTDEYYEDYWATYESRFRENRTVMSSFTIGDFQNLSYTINGSFGEDVSYIGFPTQSGQGSYVSASTSYAISSRSNHVDAAWEFLRYYLTEEYQAEGLTWGLPIQKKLLLEKAQEATKRPYYEDEEGNKVEYDDYYWINNEQIKLDPLSQEQVDELVAFIQTVNKRYYTNTEIINIINEEMEAYFSGQKTADAVAGIIQSRAQIYVDENR